MPKPKTKGGSALKEATRISLDEPKKYHVILHNDDFTTMDFVVKLLTTVFHKSNAEAEDIMLAVHHKGSAIVGTYSYDIAQSRMTMATDMARKAGFPLRITVEQAN